MELSWHDPDVKPWFECTPDERKVYVRMMEAYAGFLEHTDYHIGRLLNFLKAERRFRKHADHRPFRQRRQLGGRTPTG